MLSEKVAAAWPLHKRRAVVDSHHDTKEFVLMFHTFPRTRADRYATVLVLVGVSATFACDDGFEEAGPVDDCISAPLDELPFERDSIERLVRSPHRSTLEWVGPGVRSTAREEKQTSVVLDVRKHGELKWGLHCGGYVRFDASVTIELSEGRRATFDGHVRGTKDGAQVSGSGGLAIAKALEVPGPAFIGDLNRGFSLAAWIDHDSTRGQLSSESDTAATCPRARWPVGRPCADLSAHDEPADTSFGDLQFADIVRELQELGAQRLEWEDGTDPTMLELSIEGEPGVICAGVDYGDGVGAEYRGRKLATVVMSRLKTTDGRVDAPLPIELSVRWSERDGLVEVPSGVSRGKATLRWTGSVSRSSSALFDRGAEDARDSYTFQRVSVSAEVGRDGVAGRIHLDEVELNEAEPQIASSGAQERDSLEDVCIEGASRTREVARGSFGSAAF